MSLWLFRLALFALVIAPAFVGVYQLAYGSRKVLGAILVAADLAFSCVLFCFPWLVR